jgi:hypothetical protein
MPTLDFKRFDPQPSYPSLPAILNEKEYEYYLPDYIPESSTILNSEITISKVASPPFYRKGERPHFNIPDLKFISIRFDNDIYNNTDYYYTSGFGLRFTHPVLYYFPTSRVLLPSGKFTRDYYDVAFIQNIYTPIDPDKSEIQFGDRPFAGYLYFEFGKTSLFPEKHLKARSEFVIGVIGPGGMGGTIQSSLHEIEPLGWQNQIENDIIINYNLQLLKGIYTTEKVSFDGFGSLNAGTLYANAGMGIAFSAGNQITHFNTLQPVELRSKRIKYVFFITMSGNLIGYDATLQGGMFNKTSIYTIPDEYLNRGVIRSSLGLTITYRFAQLKVIQCINSPEFEGAKKHMYGSISLGFRLQ